MDDAAEIHAFIDASANDRRARHSDQPEKPKLKIIPTIEDVDPFDPDAFSLSQADMAPSDAAKRVLKTVPVRKPKKEEFFRVHPDPEFTSSIALLEHDGNSSWSIAP